MNTTPGYSTGLPLAIAGEVPAAVGAAARMTLYDPNQRSDELQARASAAASGAAFSRIRTEIVRRTDRGLARGSPPTRCAPRARAGALEARETIARQQRALLREGRVTQLDADRAALDEARGRQKLDAVLSDIDLDRHELGASRGPSSGDAVRASPGIPRRRCRPRAAGDAVTAASRATPV